MKKLVYLILLFSSAAFARTFTLEDEKRLIEVIDVVDGSMLADVAQKIDNLANTSSAPITMLINSPGGNVLVGTTIIDAMTLAKARGVTFKCVTGVMAASMAFIILAHCDERYTLPNAKLLFHPVSIQTSARLQEFLISAEQIQITEKEIMRFLQEKMNLPWKKFHMHYMAETMWSGWSLANHTGGGGRFLTVVDDVRGFKNLLVIEKPKPGFFLMRAKEDYKRSKDLLRKAGIFIIRDPLKYKNSSKGN